MLSITQVSLAYPGSPPLWENLSLRLQPGELLCLKGPNGCGKTSLLNLIAGIIPQHVRAECSGSISLDGLDLQPVPLRERFRFLCYQLNDPDNQIFFPRLEKELAFALENLGLPPDEMKRRIAASARYFGFDCMLDRAPDTLSSGQKKLLLLAVCECLQSPLVLLDEPSSGLSANALASLKDWLEKLLSQGRMVLVADHEFSYLPSGSRMLEL